MMITISKRWILAIALAGINLLPCGRACTPRRNFSTPSLRQRISREMLVKSRANRDEAEAWARAAGVPVQFRVGGKTVRLMAIKDGRPIYYQTATGNAAISTATDRVRDSQLYHLDGEGYTIGLWDATMPRIAHQEFQDPHPRVTAMDPFTAEQHSTSVASVIGSQGTDARATGMAPSVTIDAYDWENDTSEMAARAASYPLEPGMIHVSNHSYGYGLGWEWHSPSTWLWMPLYRPGKSMVERAFGQYGDISGEFDTVAWLAPYYLSFVAAGNQRTDNPRPGDRRYISEDGFWYTPLNASNVARGDGEVKDGFDTLGPMGVAKNVMTVGAVTDAVANGTRDLSSALMTPFSCWGPADDGRIKPDIVANGDGLYVASGDCDFCYRDGISGTSFACPNASGSAILLVQHYEHLFPRQGMRASTLKGLILHTADDLGEPGPDYRYGWGLLNTEAAVILIDDHANEEAGKRLSEGLLTAAQQTKTYLADSDGTEPIRVTLCWTDPPGSARNGHDDRTPCLVHDLDLRLKDPQGVETHYPFTLDWGNPSAPAQAGDNTRDNVEQICIADPVPGIYEIQVTYKETLIEEEQRFSLISSHGLEALDSSSIAAPWTRQFGTPSKDSGNDVAADGHGNVYVGGSTQGALFGESLGGGDAYIAKFDAAGLPLWAQQFGTGASDAVHGIAVDNAGSVYIGGVTEGRSAAGASSNDMLIGKYDANGALIWQRTLGSEAAAYSNPRTDYASDLVADMHGNIYIVGYAGGKFADSPSDGRVCLAKCDAHGNLLWIRQFGNSTDSRGRRVTVDPEGNILVTGDSPAGLASPSLGDTDVFVFKYDTDGNVLWRQALGTNFEDRAVGMTADGAGNVYVTGYTTGAFSGTSPYASGGRDAYVCKLDEKGTVLWARQFGSTRFDNGSAVSVDQTGHVFVTGLAGGPIEPYTRANQNHCFVLRISSGGNVLEGRQLDSPNLDAGLGIDTDRLGNVFVTGYTVGSLGRPNLGDWDVFLANVSMDGGPLD